jgi:tetratricopeptide (TPR) repeat protein
MAYPGNPSIAAETQKRILTTFTQTLDLARQGRIQEAALGCDFVLKMDPVFEPASELQLRLSGATGPVEVDDLVLARATAAEPSPGKSAPGGAAGASAAATVMIGPDDPVLESLRKGPAGQSQPARDQEVFELDLDATFDEPEQGELPSSGQSGVPLGALPTSPAGAGRSAFGGPALGETLGSSYSPEAAGRIEELLSEGRRQLEAGDHQAAIDSWSRIFLIDIDHEQANQLIEDARQSKAERERAVEEQYHEGVDALERGDLEAARRQLEAVVQLSPGHVGAQEHLEQLARRERGEEPASPVEPMAIEPPSGAATEGDSTVLADMFPEDGTSAQVPLVGPPLSSRSAKPSALNRPFLLIAIGVLGLVMVAGWFLWSNWATLFPNAAETAVAPKRPRVDRLQEANRLYLAGDLEAAIETARKIPAIDDDYQEAAQLVARWEQELVAQVPVEEVSPQTADEIEAQRQALLEKARRAYGEREFYRAARNFQAASKLGPLDNSANDLFEDARAQLRPIEQQLRLFRDGEYQRLLAPLWRMRVDDQQNADVRNLLVDSYFNLGVRSLRAGDPDKAASELGEIEELDPDDLMARRALRFARAYAEGTPRDLLYDIFVRALEVRTLADRG